MNPLQKQSEINVGVGNVVAISLLSNMPELSLLTNKQAASLIGVAPVNRESGSYQGKHSIYGGRVKYVR